MHDTEQQDGSHIVWAIGIAHLAISCLLHYISQNMWYQTQQNSPHMSLQMLPPGEFNGMITNAIARLV